MARLSLSHRVGSIVEVTARIDRYGTPPHDGKYLLVDVTEVGGGLLTDHLWMPVGSYAFGFRPGDRIRFKARVEPYIKGYMGTNTRKVIEARSPSVDWHLVDIADAEVAEFGPELRMMRDGQIRGGPQ